MIFAKVVGSVVSSQKHKSFSGRKILVVHPLNERKEVSGPAFLAFDDNISSGEGDFVLVLREGNGCRQIWNDKLAPVNSVIVGIVDHIADNG